jgi:hypothetical protein
MKKQEEIKKSNRKAADILRTVDKKDLSRVTGGIVIGTVIKGPPGGGGGCPTCGIAFSDQ